jgi:hypothetical protein
MSASAVFIHPLFNSGKGWELKILWVFPQRATSEPRMSDSGASAQVAPSA